MSGLLIAMASTSVLTLIGEKLSIKWIIVAGELTSITMAIAMIAKLVSEAKAAFAF